MGLMGWAPRHVMSIRTVKKQPSKPASAAGWVRAWPATEGVRQPHNSPDANHVVIREDLHAIRLKCHTHALQAIV